jgi:hypothetical protein
MHALRLASVAVCADRQTRLGCFEPDPGPRRGRASRLGTRRFGMGYLIDALRHAVRRALARVPALVASCNPCSAPLGVVEAMAGDAPRHGRSRSGARTARR